MKKVLVLSVMLLVSAMHAAPKNNLPSRIYTGHPQLNERSL